MPVTAEDADARYRARVLDAAPDPARALPASYDAHPDRPAPDRSESASELTQRLTKDLPPLLRRDVAATLALLAAGTPAQPGTAAHTLMPGVAVCAAGTVWRPAPATVQELQQPGVRAFVTAAAQTDHDAVPFSSPLPQPDPPAAAPALLWVHAEAAGLSRPLWWHTLEQLDTPARLLDPVAAGHLLLAVAVWDAHGRGPLHTWQRQALARLVASTALASAACPVEVARAAKVLTALATTQSDDPLERVNVASYALRGHALLPDLPAGADAAALQERLAVLVRLSGLRSLPRLILRRDAQGGQWSTSYHSPVAVSHTMP